MLLWVIFDASPLLFKHSKICICVMMFFFYNNDVDSLTKKKERKHQLLCVHLGFIEDNKGILDVLVCVNQ